VRSPRERPKDPCSIRGLQAGEDRTGEERESSLMPRHPDFRRWDVVAGNQGPAVVRRQVPVGEARSAGSAPPSPGCRGRPTRSGLTHVERDNPVAVQAGMCWSGRPTVRNAELRGGRRTTREANAGGRKATGNREPVTGSSASDSRITGRIGAGAPARKGADAGRVSLRRPMMNDAGTEGASWTPRPWRPTMSASIRLW
jgi:hypothetical protein